MSAGEEIMVGQDTSGCIPREILAKVVVVRITQEELIARAFKVFRTVESINFCQVELVRSSIINGANSWNIRLVFRIVVSFVADGKERLLSRLLTFTKQIPYPLEDGEFINYRKLESRVLVSDLACLAFITDGNNVILTETTFTLTVVALDDEVITVCELPES